MCDFVSLIQAQRCVESLFSISFIPLTNRRGIILLANTCNHLQTVKNSSWGICLLLMEHCQ